MPNKAMRIREVTEDDLEQINRVRQAGIPWHTATTQTQRTWWRTMPEAARRLALCAEVDGRIVGHASGEIEVTAAEPNIGTAAIAVMPEYRRQGVAASLYGKIEDHLRTVGAVRLRVNALDEPFALEWAKRLGFELGATDRFLVVDPRRLPPMPQRPDDVRVVSAREAGPETVFHVDDISARDEPGDVSYGGMPFQDWCDRFWDVIDLDVSMVVFVGGTPAATTQLQVNRETGRAMSYGSGTLPQFRGRGLIKLAKSVSLRRAAETGVTQAFTGNDETNKPMLAVNNWLGYQFVAASRSLIKHL